MKVSRDRARAAWRGRQKDIAEKGREDLARLVHELEVHQIELELQNEELRGARRDLNINPVKQAEKSLRRMSKLYTDALDPIIIVDLRGNIIDLNEEVVRMAMTAPADERPVLQDRLQRCRLMTLSLLTDERAIPEAISLTI